MEAEVKSQNIIEIADYLFQNPEMKTSEVVSVFIGKFRKTGRTIESYIKQAKEYNQIRLAKQEQVKDAILLNDAALAIEAGIFSRNQCLLTLSKIANGDTRTVEGATMIPTDSDRIKAIAQLSKMQGYDAAIKIAETDTSGNDVVKISPVEAALFINQLQVNLRHE